MADVIMLGRTPVNWLQVFLKMMKKVLPPYFLTKSGMVNGFRSDFTCTFHFLYDFLVVNKGFMV